MALTKTTLPELVDLLDEAESDFADFFRPMMGYDAIIHLNKGITDEEEVLISEIEDETNCEFPTDLIAFYMCTNGGEFGDLELYPLTTDPDVPNNMHKLNVFDKSLKEEIGLDAETLLIGKYVLGDNYVTCIINDEELFEYQLWNAKKKQVVMKFDFIVELVALEISYITDYDGLVDYANSKD